MTDNNNQSKVHYIHRISSKIQERIVGIFVLSAVLVIAGLILMQSHSSHLFDDRVIYHAYLDNAQGISTETNINVSGIEVGRVMEIDITPDNQIHVKFFVYEDFQRLIRTDSTGELNKLSVIGNTVIIINSGSPQLAILPADSTIPFEEPVTIEDLMTQLTPVITSMKETIQNVSTIIASVEPEKLKTVTDDLALFMVNLRNISEQITEGKGLVGNLLFDETLEQDVTFAVRDTGKIVKNTEKTVLLVEDILRETESRVKELKQIIEPAAELVNQSNHIAADLHSTTQVVSREIQQLPELISKMQTLLDSTNRTLNATQEIWPLSTVVSPASNETLIKDQPLDD